MSEPITPADAKAYLERWARAGEREVALARSETTALRFRQLCAMFESRHLFTADPERDRESMTVRSRWLRIRESLAGD